MDGMDFVWFLFYSSLRLFVLGYAVSFVVSFVKRH